METAKNANYTDFNWKRTRAQNTSSRVLTPAIPAGWREGSKLGVVAVLSPHAPVQVQEEDLKEEDTDKEAGWDSPLVSHYTRRRVIPPGGSNLRRNRKRRARYPLQR